MMAKAINKLPSEILSNYLTSEEYADLFDTPHKRFVYDREVMRNVSILTELLVEEHKKQMEKEIQEKTRTYQNLPTALGGHVPHIGSVGKPSKGISIRFNPNEDYANGGD